MPCQQDLRFRGQELQANEPLSPPLHSPPLGLLLGLLLEGSGDICKLLNAERQSLLPRIVGVSEVEVIALYLVQHGRHRHQCGGSRQRLTHPRRGLVRERKQRHRTEDDGTKGASRTRG